MGRERDEVEALRRRIVAEATRRFAEAGYRGTSIQQIADAVGIGKTLVLYHFPSKEALRAEVLDTVAGAWEALLPRLATSAPEQGLVEIVAFMRAHPDLPRFVLRELLDSGSDVAGSLAARVGPGTEAAAAAVQRVRGGEGSGDAHAQVILAGITLLAVLSVFEPGPDGQLTAPARARTATNSERTPLLASRDAEGRPLSSFVSGSARAVGRDGDDHGLGERVLAEALRVLAATLR